MISIKFFSITTKQTRFPANGIMCMCSLRSLVFYKCPRLESFHEGIQRLIALHHLDFAYYESLTSLSQGMKHLIALESLKIWGCRKLKFMEGEDYPMSL